jgi:hypothetical protein
MARLTDVLFVGKLAQLQERRPRVGLGKARFRELEFSIRQPFVQGTAARFD